MGVDQIIEATIINCEGKIVKADESMLQAIRGGGGTLGVIGEMTVKVYALDKVRSSERSIAPISLCLSIEID